MINQFTAAFQPQNQGFSQPTQIPPQIFQQIPPQMPPQIHSQIPAQPMTQGFSMAPNSF